MTILLGLSGYRVHDAYVARHNRGVVVNAQVIDSSYDSGGGDPGGWTSQTLSFTAADGPVTAKVGHHYPDRGAAPATVAVIFDPQDPGNVQSVQDFTEFGDYSPALFDSGFLGVGGVLLAVGLGAGLYVVVVRLRRPTSMTA